MLLRNVPVSKHLMILVLLCGLAMVETADKPAAEFHACLENEFLPAIRSGDRNKGKKILRERLARFYGDQHKSIDAVAFQTNLLAVNTAVEAARAREAGKGFAVVAEEIRRLAMRSAQATQNTAGMIEGSVRNAKNGVDLATEVTKVLEEIVQSMGKTTDFVHKIAAASQEQAQRIDELNAAIAQIDRGTQQDAANAGESAGVSEELSLQAASMDQTIAELIALAGGESQGSASPVRKSRTVPGRKLVKTTGQFNDGSVASSCCGRSFF
ncbi:MAG: methyl-accepting chemotaxis protein [Phycisphaerae bacterium]|nr:methyl-accepting chemotaxis protein [Phycisphaerae bacterium]